jgi:hypothetical protein
MTQEKGHPLTPLSSIPKKRFGNLAPLGATAPPLGGLSSSHSFVVGQEGEDDKLKLLPSNHGLNKSTGMLRPIRPDEISG